MDSRLLYDVHQYLFVSLLCLDTASISGTDDGESV